MNPVPFNTTNQDTMKTMLIITLETTGISQRDLEENLRECAQHLFANGRFTGESEGEINSWSVAVVPVVEEVL